MNKEEYRKVRSELFHTRQKAIEYNEKQVKKAMESYIADNCPFKVGDKVIVAPNKKGTIEKIYADEFGYFSFDVRFIKKDGTPYKCATNVWRMEKIQKA